MLVWGAIYTLKNAKIYVFGLFQLYMPADGCHFYMHNTNRLCARLVYQLVGHVMRHGGIWRHL